MSSLEPKGASVLGALMMCVSLAAAGESSGAASSNIAMMLVVFPDAQHRALTEREAWITKMMMTEVGQAGEATRFVFVPHVLSLNDATLMFDAPPVQEGKPLDELFRDSLMLVVVTELRLEANVLLVKQYRYQADRTTVVSESSLALADDEVTDAHRLQSLVVCQLLFSANDRERVEAACQHLRSFAPPIPIPQPAVLETGSAKLVPAATPAQPFASRFLWMAGAVVGGLSLVPIALGVTMAFGAVFHAIFSYFAWSTLDQKANGLGLRPESTYRAHIASARNTDFVLSGLSGALGVGIVSLGALSGLIAVALVVYGFVR